MLVTEAPESDLTLTAKPVSSPATTKHTAVLSHPDVFARRHIGPSADETRQMLELLGYPNLDALIKDAVPAQIRLGRPLQIPAGRSEFEVLAALREIASQNQVFRSFIGMGY